MRRADLLNKNKKVKHIVMIRPIKGEWTRFTFDTEEQADHFMLLRQNQGDEIQIKKTRKVVK